MSGAGSELGLEQGIGLGRHGPSGINPGALHHSPHHTADTQADSLREPRHL